MCELDRTDHILATETPPPGFLLCVSLHMILNQSGRHRLAEVGVCCAKGTGNASQVVVPRTDVGGDVGSVRVDGRSGAGDDRNDFRNGDGPAGGCHRGRQCDGNQRRAGHGVYPDDGSNGFLHRPLPDPRHVSRDGGAARVQEGRAAGHRGNGECADARRLHSQRRQRDRDGGGDRGRAARAKRQRGNRAGDRAARGAAAAAERAQLRPARLPGAGG